MPVTAAGGQVLNLVADAYNNPVRAGYSSGMAELFSGAPAPPPTIMTICSTLSRSATPVRSTTETASIPLAARGCPSNRMRRFVTPVDIDGSGRVLRWGVPWPTGDVGADGLGRVNFAGYFRPPGAPGLISVAPGSAAAPGSIVYPSAQNDLFYTSAPNPANLTFPSYLPDVTNNPLHGFESFKNPNLPAANGNYSPQAIGGMPADQNLASGIPGGYPTYDLKLRNNGLNEADEMNLYKPDRAARFPLRSPRPRMALPVAGRRRRLALEPAGRPGPGQLHQHHRRPATAAAVRDRKLGVESVRLGQ